MIINDQTDTWVETPLSTLHLIECKISQDTTSCRKGLKSLLELLDHASINPCIHSLAGRSLGFGAGVLPRCRAPVKAANSARVGFEKAASPRTDRNIWSCPRVDRRRCQGRTIWARLLFGDQLNVGLIVLFLFLFCQHQGWIKQQLNRPETSETVRSIEGWCRLYLWVALMVF